MTLLVIALAAIGVGVGVGYTQHLASQGASSSKDTNSTSNPSCADAPWSFAVNATTLFGENIYLSGDTAGLGAWNETAAILMLSTNYTDTNHLWYLDVDLKAKENVDYKYLRKEKDGTWIKESLNRTISAPSCGQTGNEVDIWTGTVPNGDQEP